MALRGAPALPNTASNLLHWLGDISAGPECTVEFFFVVVVVDLVCVVSQLYMLYIVFPVFFFWEKVHVASD